MAIIVLAPIYVVKADVVMSPQADSLMINALEYVDAKDWNNATTAFLELSNYCKDYYGENSFYYAFSLYLMGFSYSNNLQYSEAIEFFEKSYNVTCQLDNQENDQEREAFNFLLNYYLCGAYTNETTNESSDFYIKGYNHFMRFMKEYRAVLFTTDDSNIAFKILETCCWACTYAYNHKRWADCIYFSEIGFSLLNNCPILSLTQNIQFYGALLCFDFLPSYYIGCYDKTKLYQELYMDNNIDFLLSNINTFLDSDLRHQALTFALHSANMYHYVGDYEKESILLNKMLNLTKVDPDIISHNDSQRLSYYVKRSKLTNSLNEQSLKEMAPSRDLPFETVEYTNLMANYYMKQGKLKEAYKYIISCPDSILSQFSGTIIEQDYFINKCLIELKLGYSEKGIESVLDYCRRITEYIKYNFPRLISLNREQFFEKNSRWFTDALPLFLTLSNDSRLIQSCYDATLIYKNALLESNSNLVRLAHISSDPSLLHSLNDYKSKEVSFLQHYHLALNDKLAGNDTFDTYMELLFELTNLNYSERKALDFVNSYEKPISDFMESTWDSIARKLNSTDVAIEFVHVADNLNNNLYYALVLKKNYNCPHLIKLCQEKDLVNLDINAAVNEAYRLIWAPLEHELHNAENVFFSADGLLHITPIEYCVLPNGQYLSECYNVLRLSSTRKLIKQISNPITHYKKAYIFGDIDFGASLSDIQTAIDNYRKDNRRSLIDIKNVSSIESDYAGGSLILHPWENFTEDVGEIEEIKEILNQNSISVSVFDKSLASEDLIKSLSFKKVVLIHFSTHGLYVSQDSTQYYPYLKFVERFSNSMFRGILVCSGVNNLIKTGRGNEKLCDGLLLAYDIANLNLENVDLVVLSTCDSGLGDITPDGVWGIQRGFKQAGCNSILMSLSAVDEDATCSFMKTFYKYLFLTQSKLKALSLAQQEIRKTKDFSEPKYWASFILLDAF